MRYLITVFLFLAIGVKGSFAQNIIVSDPAPAATVRFYPNPVTNVLTITPSAEVNNAFLFVSDVRGRIIAKSMIMHIDGGQEFQYEMNDLSAGIYVCVLQTGDQQFAQRIMVQ